MLLMANNGCEGPTQHIITITKGQDIRDLPLVDQRNILKEWARQLRIEPRTDAIQIYVDEEDPPGFFTGFATVGGVPHGKPAAALLATFRHAPLTTRVDIEPKGLPTVVTLDAVAVVTSAANGSLCIGFKGTSQAARPLQVVEGQFSVLGGTGPAARLRVSGPFLGILPSLPQSSTASASVSITAVPKQASLAPPRGLTAACRKAMSPPAPPPKVTATLDGYAFAPPGTTKLPAGTQIFPDGSTISGAIGCGQPLYMIVTYAGPAGARATGGFYGPQTVTIDQPVSPSQNALLLFASPPNGSYSAKVSVNVGATGTSFGGNLALTRTC
jgi:hypothetical protein